MTRCLCQVQNPMNSLCNQKMNPLKTYASCCLFQRSFPNKSGNPPNALALKYSIILVLDYLGNYYTLHANAMRLNLNGNIWLLLHIFLLVLRQLLGIIELIHICIDYPLLCLFYDYLNLRLQFPLLINVLWLFSQKIEEINIIVSIENLVHNDCFDYFSCIHFLSTIYSEYVIDFSYSSYLIYYSCYSSQVLQVITLKLLFSVIYISGYFYLVQAYLYSSSHLLP